MIMCIFDNPLSQVLTLLDYMNLKQYKDSFSTEVVDGAIFAQLDDTILEHDLGVQSRLHRLKLLRVITGKQSVMQLASIGSH